MTSNENVCQIVSDLIDLKDRALAATDEGITISDPSQPDNPIIFANRGFELITGYSIDEILGQNCRFLQGPETDHATSDLIRDALKNEVHCTVEILNYRKDGTPFWNRLSINPVRDQTGNTTHFIGILSDVTRRRLAEEALQQTNEQLQLANQQMKEDLHLAAQVQQTLLPDKLPVDSRIRFDWRFLPCRELAGDILNIIQLDSDHIAFYVLDVAGHGVSAALLSFTLSNYLNGNPDDSCLYYPDPSGCDYLICSPKQVVERLNRNFPMNMRTGQYFTIVYGLINLNNQTLQIVSAGHPCGIMIKHNRPAELLSIYGYPPGIVPDAEYEQTEILLTPGDRFYFYTDGVTEAINHQNEPFGINQLLGVLNQSQPQFLDKIMNQVITKVQNWSKGHHPSDDISIIAFEYQPDNFNFSEQGMYYV